MKKHPKATKNPNSPLRLSRAKWKCSGKKSRRSWWQKAKNIIFVMVPNILVALIRCQTAHFIQAPGITKQANLFFTLKIWVKERRKKHGHLKSDFYTFPQRRSPAWSWTYICCVFGLVENGPEMDHRSVNFVGLVQFRRWWNGKPVQRRSLRPHEYL